MRIREKSLPRAVVEHNATEGRYDARAEAVEDEVRALVASQPPPPHSPARSRLEARFGSEHPSGIHDVEELLRQGREAVIASVKDKLSEEREARKVAEAKLEKIQDERRKFWSTIVAGVLIGLITAAVTWAVVRLVAMPAGHAG